MNLDDKYNMLVNEMANSTSDNIEPKNFKLDYQEFKAIIVYHLLNYKEIENSTD